MFARFDIAYSGVDGPEEPSVNHALSGGSENQKFKPIKCTVGESEKQRADNCPHFEMRKFIDSVAETAGLDSDIEGKQWVQGDSGGKNGQGVKGGKGLLKWVNGGWEPAGIHPFGVNSHTKFVLKQITEYPDKKSTARLNLAFQFCVSVPILGQQCTPHFLVIPTPFVVKEDGLFLVASRRNLPTEIARLRNQTLAAGVYCDPDQIIASAGQSDSSPANTKYGHLPYEETTEQLYNVTAVDGATVGLTQDAAAAFEQMREAAAAQGLDIKAVSGFRSRKLQAELFSDQVAKQGGSIEAAAKISAPAGHSEHHTGLAVDVGNNANPYLNESWANTPEYAWMQQNAGKYGFELSFPKGNSQGVSYEPWHWRFVGSDAAKSTFASASGQSTGTQGTKAQTVGQSAWGSETDVYNLILTSALESTGTQKQVDVAVAIMNRVVSPKHPNTITDVVFQPKQYEPNFGQAR
ncbi:D-alanyl-D-alanine carboxypeptidase family protein [Acaryochloris sp. CCMEE 5410]|uniref:D-alanyl-D-alanine carboxypeptidase family protein n=1 Tax=Acaryochloris sp. CCMEE 5410 TaxID=310037 RepID=UPI0021CFF9E6|nr:D-alanyl-D-alanine carboxypeptidase family protein [Acaryochloris sp. CCMEE 5410]